MNNIFISKVLLIGALLTFIHLSLFSQVKGISYTFSPGGEYIFTSKKSGMGDGFAATGQLGFGFGEFIQLNANYLKTFNTLTDFDAIAGPGSSIPNKKFSLSRYGGEFKVNVSRRKLEPFLSVGTGVQSISTDDIEKSKQIYLTTGLGLNLHIIPRANLAIEMVNTSYRLNAFNTFMTETERITLLGTVSNATDFISDLSAKASFSLFLGGQQPSSLINNDMEYLSQFSNGFRGLSIPVEINTMMVKFNEKLPFKNTFYSGLSTGLDFGPYIGLRGFYLRAMEDGLISSFSKSAIWGGETKFKLNNLEGVVPYITIGGGRIDVYDGYDARVGTIAENKVFASGGLGLEISLSRGIKIMGFANGLLTSIGDLNDLSQPQDLVSSISYGAKVGFIIGKKTQIWDNITDSILQNQKTNLSGKPEKGGDDKVREYKMQPYKNNQELQTKSEKNITDNTALDSLKEGNNNVDSNELNTKTVPIQIEKKNNSLIRVTPDELISIIREIKAPVNYQPISSETYDVPKKENSKIVIAPNVDTIVNNSLPVEQEQKVNNQKVEIKRDTIFIQSGKENNVHSTDSIFNNIQLISKQLNFVNNQLDDFGELSDNNKREMENVLEGLKSQMEGAEKLNENLILEIRNQQAANESVSNKLKELSNIDKEISDLTKQIKKLENKMDQTKGNVELARIPESKSIPTDTIVGEKGKIKYEFTAVFAGFNLGKSSSANLGLRWKYKISKTNFNIVPEAYLGIGSSVYLGLFMNSTYDFKMNQRREYQPYAGIGFGMLNTHENNNVYKVKGAYSIIIGSQIPGFSNGQFYIDLTIRNLFKYNQLTLGYKLPF